MATAVRSNAARDPCRTDLLKMERWIRSTTSVGHTMLMPLKDKRPLFKHSGKNVWGWNEYEAFRQTAPLHASWGLLLDRVCAVDADSEETWRRLENEADAEAKAALSTCPVQETGKGRHYLFLRPTWADEEGYYDGARQAAAVDDGLDADFKSLCSTGTRGVLAIAPSEKKHWAVGRAPWDAGVQMQTIPRVLLDRVATAKHPSSKSKTRSKAKSKTTPERKDPPPLPASTAALDDVQLLLQLLNKSRWDHRKDWRDIATSLKNYAGNQYKEDWVRLSRISAKFDAKEAEKLWMTVATPTYTGVKLKLGTIHKMAKADDPLRYTEYRLARIPAVVMNNWDKEDRGLADIAVHLLNSQVKRVGTKGVIYYFDEEDCRWREGTEATIRRIVSVALESSLREIEMYFAARASAENDETRRAEWDAKKKLACERIKYVRKHSGMCNVTAVAVHMFQDDDFELLLDSRPYLLGVQNGVIDLRTGELRDREPEDMIFTVLNVIYDPDADTSVFQRVVREAMADDEAMVAFLQKLLGYGITGEVSEAIFAIFTGEGRNSKGLITQTLRKLLGKDLYKEMMTGVIVQRQVANLDAERGKLLGARIAVFNELEPGDKLKLSEVQLLSGCDGIPATPKFRNPMTIEPRHLCILTTNYMPELAEVKLAIIRRLVCVHFPVSFTDLADGEAPTLYKRQCDQNLGAYLNAHLDGVLAWLVQGAIAWYADAGSLHRCAPTKVTEFSRKYFESQDKLTAFLADVCETGCGAEYRVSSTELLDAFNNWSGKQDRKNPSWFVEKMRAKGYDSKVRRVRGVSMQSYEGVRIRAIGCLADEVDDDVLERPRTPCEGDGGGTDRPLVFSCKPS